MLTRTESKSYFDGVKYAEEVGAKEAAFQLNIHAFDDPTYFNRGVLDYIHHDKKLQELKELI